MPDKQQKFLVFLCILSLSVTSLIALSISRAVHATPTVPADTPIPVISDSGFGE